MEGEGTPFPHNMYSFPAMSDMEVSTICCVLAVIEVLGLLVAWIARISEGSRQEARFRWLFFACLTLVGGITIVSLTIGPGYWLAAGATLAIMVLTVTCDFRGARHATAY